MAWLLIIESDDELRVALREAAVVAGHQVIEARSFAEAQGHFPWNEQRDVEQIAQAVLCNVMFPGNPDAKNNECKYNPNPVGDPTGWQGSGYYGVVVAIESQQHEKPCVIYTQGDHYSDPAFHWLYVLYGNVCYHEYKKQLPPYDPDTITREEDIQRNEAELRIRDRTWAFTTQVTVDDAQRLIDLIDTAIFSRFREWWRRP